MLIVAYAGPWVTFDQRYLGADGLGQLDGVTPELDQLDIDETADDSIASSINRQSDTLEVSGDLSGSQTIGFILPLLAVVGAGAAFMSGRSGEDRLALLVFICGAAALALTALKLVAIAQASNGEELSNWAPWLALLSAAALVMVGLRMVRSPQ